MNARRRRPLVAPEKGEICLVIQTAEDTHREVRAPAVVDFIYRRGNYVVVTKSGQRLRAGSTGHVPHRNIRVMRPADEAERVEILEFLASPLEVSHV